MRLCGRHAPDGSKIQFPRSISFLGRIYDEGSPLRVALAYEQATAWHRVNPAWSLLDRGSKSTTLKTAS